MTTQTCGVAAYVGPACARKRSADRLLTDQSSCHPPMMKLRATLSLAKSTSSGKSSNPSAKRTADPARARVWARGGVRMAKVTLTYGDLPTKEQFDALWAEADPTTPSGKKGFGFGNDPRLGCCVLSRDETWAEVEKAWNEYADQLGHPGSLSQDP